MPDNAGTSKRSLPSWMSSKEKETKPKKKKQRDDNDDDGYDGDNGDVGSKDNAQTSTQFSKLMEGVVFVLSGFVNPERSTLRSQAMNMGAEYRGDWTSDCTLLVCAFPNTPKFRQVESDCGTIVSKEWITECYNQKKLVEIDAYLMHAGKPWRKNNNRLERKKAQKDLSHEEPKKRPGNKSPEKQTGPAKSKGESSSTTKVHFPSSKIKQWANDDLKKTVKWLESQEEKPEASEVKAIAAEGIITCLQDAIDSLKENKDIRLVMEQWMFIPHVVEELAELESGKNKMGSISKAELCNLAVTCKDIYESELQKLIDHPKDKTKMKKKKTNSDKEENENVHGLNTDEGSDSDQTIEMTEEEIEIACKQLSS